MFSGNHRTPIAFLAAVALLSACGAAQPPSASVDQQPQAQPTSQQSISSDPSGVPAPNGRRYPQVPNSAAALGQQLQQVEKALLAMDSDDPNFPALAHRQQVLYRRWSHHRDWDGAVLKQLNAPLRPVAEQQVQARREFLAMHRNSPPPAQLPAWRIVSPAPAAELLSFYQEAERQTGIDWATLAAINLVETGMGRLQGLSVAGARGPMQFLPTTWAEPGIGAGSIDDPADAIAAAARYLVRRGGPENMPQAIWGYNNSWNYVRAVQTYADLMREEPRRLNAFHQWQIHYASPMGDLWLPEGYERQSLVPVATFIEQAPWSAPPAR
jgi:membrane-bound lytic murein transglycosylase B